jgi:hypothetical protein
MEVVCRQDNAEEAHARLKAPDDGLVPGDGLLGDALALADA